MGIGERVAEARAGAGLTQAQLASAIGIGRSALAKIETGARRVSATELVAIAQELRQRVEWFIAPGPPSIVSYRALKSDVAPQAIDMQLNAIVRDVEVVAAESPGLIGDQPDAIPPPRSIADADQLAAVARRDLGLSVTQPALDLANLVTAIGLLPFSVHLGEGADAGTVLLPIGGVAVINGDLRSGRRRLALAHELGHYLIADPYTTDWRISESDDEALEALLDRFARALLLPEIDLGTRWNTWMELPDETLRDAAVRAGSHYRVDMATLARRLYELRLVSADQANAIRQVRTRRADIVEKNLVVHDELAPVALPRPYERAVLSLYRSETVTADRAIGLLLGTFDHEALPDLPAVPEADIWAVTS
ncbi:helix-turn-helix domain-containing protein [Actinomadura hibisca]|uniref:helix-turn-helix domain-containing protein n=1 Tax=Actinomadura hibisca TaxID=68565 RepID=UPI0008372968|nr:helix-turn-helix domain-containing protein [Actinomadura hibisca]